MENNYVPINSNSDESSLRRTLVLSEPMQQGNYVLTLEQFQDIQNGLGSALAIIDECYIGVPADHPDPKAIDDCKLNVRDAYSIVLGVRHDNQGANVQVSDTRGDASGDGTMANKELAIGFAEWIDKEYDFYAVTGLWYHYSDRDADNGKSTQDLLTLYQQHLKQQ